MHFHDHISEYFITLVRSSVPFPVFSCPHPDSFPERQPIKSLSLCAFYYLIFFLLLSLVQQKSVICVSFFLKDFFLIIYVHVCVYVCERVCLFACVCVCLCTHV